MRNRNILILILLISVFFTSRSAYLSDTESTLFSAQFEQEKEKNLSLGFQLDEVTYRLDSIETAIWIEKTNKFNYVYGKFSAYNYDIESSTVEKWIQVAEHYNLDSTQLMFDYFISQILLESGAQQYYKTGHPKEGRLVSSYAGATGFCQIMPGTAYGFLKKYVTEEDRIEFAKLGATNFDFVDKYESRSTTKESFNEAIEWLSNETNNIVMWGYIMRYSFEKRDHNLIYSLIAYNAGGSNLESFLNNGNNPYSHPYIQGINSIMLKDAS